MKKVLTLFSILFMLVSCDTEDDSYSYLHDPEVEAESVEMKYSVSSEKLVFDYILRAREMVIDWGDGSKPSEYVYVGRPNHMDSIKAMSYTYASDGEYNILVRALHLNTLDLTPVGDNELSELKLSNCTKLKTLNCLGQPIPQLDLSECPELRVLTCGNPRGVQDVSGLSVLLKLEEITMSGVTSPVVSDFTANTLLKTVSIKESDVVAVNLSGLSHLSSLTLTNCQNLEEIMVGDNSSLQEVILTDNTLLDDAGLNCLFESLPQAPDDLQCSVTLRNNKGDAVCDISIATAKGWVFIKN